MNFEKSVKCQGSTPAPDPDGSFEGWARVGDSPTDLAFAGTSVWVTNSGDNTVDKLEGHGGIQRTYSVGNHPTGILFDGTSIWVANYFDSTVNKISKTQP